MVRILSVNDALALDLAVEIVLRNEPLIYPTDTIYGIGGNALSQALAQQIYLIKKRPASLPFSIMVSDLEMLSEYAVISESAQRIAERFFPGPLTLILPLKQNSPLNHIAADDNSAGFRMPDHSFCREITKRTLVPIITTSANISGEAPMTTMDKMAAMYSDSVSLYLRDDSLESRKNTTGSTIVKIEVDDRVELIRSGVLDFLAIQHFLSQVKF